MHVVHANDNVHGNVRLQAKVMVTVNDAVSCFHIIKAFTWRKCINLHSNSHHISQHQKTCCMSSHVDEDESNSVVWYQNNAGVSVIVSVMVSVTRNRNLNLNINLRENLTDNGNEHDKQIYRKCGINYQRLLSNTVQDMTLSELLKKHCKFIEKTSFQK